jgi:hypothetical protein
MTTGDEAVESAADKLRQASERAAARGGLAAKLAGPLAEDSAFVRKLKPSLVKARLRGESPPEPAAPGRPQLGPRSQGEPNPFVLLGVAFVAGILLAKLIDWRGHAHPRD